MNDVIEATEPRGDLVRMYFGYTYNQMDPFNHVIRIGTGGKFAHVLIAFEYDSGDKVYFESIVKKSRFVGPLGMVEHKSGLRGPIPFERLQAWQQVKPKRRSVYIQPIKGVEPYEVLDSYNFLAENVPLITYAKLQIIQNAKYLLTGRLGKVKNISPNEWTCSESGFRCLNIRIQHAMGLGNFLYDWVTPSGAHGFGLLEMVERWNKTQQG